MITATIGLTCLLVQSTTNYFKLCDETHTEFLDNNADERDRQNEEEELVDPQMNHDETPEHRDQTVVTDGLLLLLFAIGRPAR